MSGFSCCFWWFLIGFLLGWLLNWLLSRCCSGCHSAHASHNQAHDAHSSAPAPVKAAEPVKVVEPVAPKKVVIDLAAAKAAGFKLKNVDDLTIVEGIGPKINELLNNDGIVTFAQLAQASIPTIQAILDKAGARYRLAKPGTWPQQAALAAENRWAELKKLQDSLKGGV